MGETDDKQSILGSDKCCGENKLGEKTGQFSVGCRGSPWGRGQQALRRGARFRKRAAVRVRAECVCGGRYGVCFGGVFKDLGFVPRGWLGAGA